jgi:hypothetical protein
LTPTFEKDDRKIVEWCDSHMEEMCAKIDAVKREGLNKKFGELFNGT